MKTSVLSLAVLATTVSAQLGDFDPCVISCINKYVQGNTIAGCGALDYKCVCTNQKFLSDVSCCVFKGCAADKQQGIIDFAHNICGPDATALPTKATCTGADAPASTPAGSAPASGSTAPPATTAAPNSAAGSSNAAPSGTSSSKGGAAVVGAPAGVLGAVAGLVMAL